MVLTNGNNEIFFFEAWSHIGSLGELASRKNNTETNASII